MKQFTAQRTLRSAYIGRSPIYGACVNCKMPYLHDPTHPLAGKPAKSKYPYCFNCLQKNAQDPYFKAWLLKLFPPPVK